MGGMGGGGGGGVYLVKCILGCATSAAATVIL